MTRPGDKQPPYREAVLFRCREAARIAQEFDRSMREIKTAISTPEEIRELARRVVALAEKRAGQ